MPSYTAELCVTQAPAKRIAPTAVGQFSADYYRHYYKNYLRQNPVAKMRFYRDLVSSHAPFAKGVILDLGCAFGRFLSTFDPGWRRVGIDISEHAIRQASRSVAGVNFAVADASAVSLQAKCDAIVAFDVIEHVPDLDAVAAFVDASLSDQGVFAFVVPVYDGPLGGVVRCLDRDPTHVHKQSREFWLTWARRHFEVCEWTGIFRYLLPVGPYLHWPTKLLRDISPAVAVAARRKRA